MEPCSCASIPPGVAALSRREWIRWCGAAGALFLYRGAGFAEEPRTEGTTTPAKTAVDHLLLGAADLDAGISWVEKLTGVKAVAGGSHPGVGTRNALVALGKKQYLEIIAPDPEQKEYKFPIDVRKLAEPRIVTWAALAGDIARVAKEARDAGFQVFGPADGGRVRPDGRKLSWKSLGVFASLPGEGTPKPRPIDPIPFFIEWAAESQHPASDAPKGCELVDLELEHPLASAVRDTLRKLGLDARVTEAKEPKLLATLKTPKGKLVLC